MGFVTNSNTLLTLQPVHLALNAVFTQANFFSFLNIFNYPHMVSEKKNGTALVVQAVVYAPVLQFYLNF